MNNRILLSWRDFVSLNEHQYELLTNIFSDKFGIINAFLERNEYREYGLHAMQALTAQTSVLFSQSREISSGGIGLDASKERALDACIGESIERYCMSYFNPKEFLFSYYHDLPANRRINDFHLYSSKQYELHAENFADPISNKIYWVQCQSVFDSSVSYLPASQIFLPFEMDKPVTENTSTGVASHRTLDNAILSGVLELIERDALMINFCQKLPLTEIDIETVDLEEENAFLHKVRSVFNVKILDIQLDIKVSTYLCFIWRDNPKLHFGIGACAHLDSKIAIQKALKECLFTYHYSESMLDLKPNDKGQIKTLYEHFLYYQDEKFYSLINSAKVQKYIAHSLDRDTFYAALNKSATKFYYKDITTPDIKHLPIKVVKVMAPGLIDLNKSNILRLGAKRFWEVPAKLGLPFNEKLSEFPHPFP